MKIAVFGGTGFVGKRLEKLLKDKGHQVFITDTRKDKSWEKTIADADAVVNLAGAPVFGKRWNQHYKSLIHSSRVEGTQKIVASMAKAKSAGKGPKVFVSASAVGFYGPHQDDIVTEKSGAGTDFMAFVCRDWEDAAKVAGRAHGIRTAIVRIGVVLGKDGGALEKLKIPFFCFIGGPVEFGRQYMSWVHIDDVCGIIIHALENENVSGALNATAPTPVTNKEFSRTLGKAIDRPSFLPVPGFALGLLFGEVADILVNGQRVVPEATLASGYRFKFTDLEAAFKDVLLSH